MVAKCPECGHEVSTNAKICPSCGCPLCKNKKNELKINKKANGSFETGFAVGFFLNFPGLFLCLLTGEKETKRGALRGFGTLILVLLFGCLLVSILCLFQ